VKALCWAGVNETSVETVDDPKILNDHDIILRVKLSTTCGSDLHLLGGYIPTMRAGDVLGHEFMGEVVEVGPAVRNHQVGDRVVVCSFVACGQCWYCQNQLFSL
jgi:threonine dehydrogenase-like Zn-dependent dehydrogenase